MYNKQKITKMKTKKLITTSFCVACLASIMSAQYHFRQTQDKAVFVRGELGTWDQCCVWNPAVVKDGDTLRMWYTGYDANVWSNPGGGIGYAWSLDGIQWNRYERNPVLVAGYAWETPKVSFCTVILDADTFKMWYGAATPSGSAPTIGGYAYSLDGKSWTKYPDPVLQCGPAGDWDDALICPSTVIKEEDGYKMWFYGGRSGFPFESSMPQTGLATSADGVHWTKYNNEATAGAPYAASDPVIKVGAEGEWDSHRIFGTIVLPTATGYEAWYQGVKPPFNTSTPCHIGFATSENGIDWEKWPNNPVFVDAPEIVSWGKTYYTGSILYFEDYYHMWFSCFHTKYQAMPEIGYATSNYILVDPPIGDITLVTEESISIDLDDHFQYIQGIPDSTVIEDTITYTLKSIPASDTAEITLEGTMLNIMAGAYEGSTTFEIMASAGFTKNYSSVIVAVQRPTGVDNQTKNSGFSIYPNPTNKLVTIETGIPDLYKICITSLNGQLINSREMEGTSHQIDLSSFRKGVYFMTIRSKDFVSTKKIVKL